MSWFILHSGRGAPGFNMALDEALLETMPRLKQPVLRFYGWSEPAASFGYFQKYREVEGLTPLRPLVRRPTGGGIVPHDADWTYSLVFPVQHEWYSLPAIESYRRVHEWIKAAFARLGLVTNLSPHAVKTQPGQCFAGCEQSDLLWGGKKIAGAAQRRRREGLLIQGSIQPAGMEARRELWQQAMAEVGGEEFGTAAREFMADESLNHRVLALRREKFDQPKYNQRR